MSNVDIKKVVPIVLIIDPTIQGVIGAYCNSIIK